MIRGVGFAREMLEAGFTTVRDLGEAGNHGDTDLRRAIEEGFVPGPTMVNAGRPIVPLGGGAPANPEKPDFNLPEKIEADTPDELKKAVWENIHYGARVIKIIIDGKPYIYSAEELKLVVEVAARAGIRVAAHAVTDAGGRNAAAARVASIEHGTQLSLETLALAKNNEVVLVPTPFTPFLIREMGIRLSGTREDEDYRDYERVHAGYVASLERIHQSGVTIAFGSDVGVVAEGHTRGQLAISTIESYLAAGVPAADILRALTINAARLVGVDKERGAIKPGLAADMVATPENPLQDIRTLTRVAFVMKEGEVYKQEPQAAGRRAPTAR
jgi:imidazolonepropionase-like amidohydrolase